MNPTERPQVGDTVEWCGGRFTVRSIHDAWAHIASDRADYTVRLDLLRVVRRANPQGVLL